MGFLRIEELRKDSGMTQEQLAERMGVIRTAVTNWETESALPRTRQLPLLASVLGCSINDLFVSGKEE